MTNIVHLQPATATFEDFWRECPKKVGKPLAEAKWRAITTTGLVTRTLDRDSGTYVEIELRATPEELIEGMKRYYKSLCYNETGLTWKLKVDKQYILHPATFLNQGRWLDE